MKHAALAALFAVAAFSAGWGQEEPLPVESSLVVHEWGTFTSVSGADGVALDWRPLAGPSDLPSFVYQLRNAPNRGFRWGPKCTSCGHFGCACGTDCRNHDAGRNGCCKFCTTASVRMETPVIYFYADRKTKVAVEVGFPKGRVTEWYPRARDVENGIRWGGLWVLPGEPEGFPREAADSHYYPARETDAAPVQVCGTGKPELEKFLFYRGVGTFEQPLKAALVAEGVSLRGEVGKAILFENRGGRCGFRVAAGGATFARPDLGRPLDDLLAELRRTLVAEGLYEKEAAAMVKTWTDSWFEEGLRVLYVLPRAATDAILPLKIDPKPRELVRVLVGRLEILTPEREREIETLAARLGSEDPAVRDAATASLRRAGRFAEPVLKRIQASTSDPEVKVRIADLLNP